MRFFQSCAVVTFMALFSIPVPSAAEPESDKRRLEARDKGVAHLIKKLQAGTLGDNYHPWIRCNDHAITGLALLCEGSGWETGKHREHHARLVKYLQANRFVGTDNVSYYMGVWGHGYMIWYLVELAETASAANRAALDAFAVQLIAELCSWQSTDSGGWGHHPKLLPTVSGYSEFSVITALSLNSLLRARDKGYYVDERVIERAFRYLDKVIGLQGAPRYSAERNVAVGNEREGAPRGAMVMLPYTLDKRNTRLLGYLKSCKDFTGGHASAALGMCHSALLFAAIDDYMFFWRLHGKDILDRQKEDGSFTALRPGERTDEERAEDLSDALHTWTLAVPEAPWKRGQLSLPATTNGGYAAIIARAKAAAARGKPMPSMEKIAAMNPQDRQRLLATTLTEHLQGLLKESEETGDETWLRMLLDPYALCEVVARMNNRLDVNIVIPPLVVADVEAEAKLMLKDRVLAEVKLKPDARKAVTKRLTARETADIDISDITLHIKWTWSGKNITTSHQVMTSQLAPN